MLDSVIEGLQEILPVMYHFRPIQFNLTCFRPFGILRNEYLRLDPAKAAGGKRNGGAVVSAGTGYQSAFPFLLRQRSDHIDGPANLETAAKLPTLHF
jgi:hypothetical protein